MKQTYFAHRLLSLIICFTLIFTLGACTGSSQGEPVGSVPSNNSSGNVSSSEDVSSVGSVVGEISITENFQSGNNVESVEKRVQIYDADLSTSKKGYAEKEATALRNEILSTGNTEEYYKIKGTKYYISSNGSDENDGLSPQTAFKTIDPLESIELKKGDAILFERGGIYRFKRAIYAKSGLTYGSYGSGLKPAIYGSPFNAKNVTWTPSKKKNVWFAEFLYGDACGLFINHGEIAGRRINIGIGALERNGDFYHDTTSGMVYMYCDEGNPAKVYDSIEISPTIYAFVLHQVEDVVIDNLCVKYAAYGITGGIVKNVYVTNCEFGYLGGLARSDVRYGNAMEMFAGPNINVYYEHNWVYQTFDTALTWQGWSEPGTEIKNISFSNNLLEYNNADFEIWEGNGTILDNFKMNNNIMRYTSSGWGTRADDGGIRGIEGCIKGNFSGMIIKNTVEFKNNIIDCPSRQIFWFEIDVEQREKLINKNNTIFYKESYRTTSEVLRNYPDSTGNKASVKVKNLEELKKAMQRFDPTAKIAWYK